MGKDSDGHYVWFCHYCYDGPFLGAHNFGCSGCGHIRCPDCSVQLVEGQDTSSGLVRTYEDKLDVPVRLYSLDPWYPLPQSPVTVAVAPLTHPTSIASEPVDVRMLDESDDYNSLEELPDISDMSGWGDSPSPNLGAMSMDVDSVENDNIEHLLNPIGYFASLDALEDEIISLTGFNGTDHRFTNEREVAKGFENILRGFERLQREGFAAKHYSILVEDPKRDEVALTRNVSHGDLLDLRSILENFENHQVQLAIATIKRCFSQLSVPSDDHLTTGSFQPSECTQPNHDAEDIASFLDLSSQLYSVLALGLISYSGSHACAFDEKLPAGSNRIFRINSRITLQQKKLACLTDFVGGPVWIFGLHALRKPEFKISITLQDFADLWGPLHGVWDKKDPTKLDHVRTERGILEALSRNNVHGLDELGLEIPCHWRSSKVRSYTFRSWIDRIRRNWGYQLHKVAFHTNALLLIGAPKQWDGLQCNQSCTANMSTLRPRIGRHLFQLGTSNPEFRVDEYELGFSGGQFLSLTGNMKTKRYPGLTYKGRLLQLLVPGIKANTLKAILQTRAGVCVSVITGCAQRVRLWDLLRVIYRESSIGADYRFSPAVPETSAQQQSSSWPCSHEVGDLCIGTCWQRTHHSTSTTSTVAPTFVLSNNGTPDPEFISFVCSTLRTLDYTGLNSADQLEAYWPFEDLPHILEIGYDESPFFDRRTNVQNRWIPMLKDTRDVGTFAIVVPHCLSPEPSGGWEVVQGHQCDHMIRKRGNKTYDTHFGSVLQLHPDGPDPANIGVGEKLRIDKVGKLVIKQPINLPLAELKAKGAQKSVSKVKCLFTKKGKITHRELMYDGEGDNSRGPALAILIN